MERGTGFLSAAGRGHQTCKHTGYMADRPRFPWMECLPSSWSSQPHRVYREPQWVPLNSEEQLPPLPFPSSNLKAFVRLCMLKSGSLAVSSGNLGSPTHPPKPEQDICPHAELSEYFLSVHSVYLVLYTSIYISLYMCVCVCMCIYIYILSLFLFLE